MTHSSPLRPETSKAATPAGADPAERALFALAEPPPQDPRQRRALAQTLELLRRLKTAAEAEVAALLYWLPEREARLDADLRRALPGLADLREGLAAAARVRALYLEHGGGGEGLRRLLLAMVRDLRGVPVFLACELVRLRQAADQPEAERQALARLSADLLAPLANRLGIWQLKWEMEDLAFRYLQPDTYKRIAALLDGRRGDREAFIETCKTRLSAALAEAGIEADVAGRPKHIFSIWKKMQRKQVPFGELYDIRAVRVLVADLAACYAALGVVHTLWTPVPSEFDDYIAKPKGNNYRSLHTAVIGPRGKTLEVQIRSREMHEHAELGVAAHWLYKEGKGSADPGFERKIAWMRQLLESSEGEADSALLAGWRSELVEDRIYVLTPRGEVVDLPRGGTVLDFAYHVHTEVGHRCRGAKVNGRIVPLNHSPQTGDRVEILTGKEAAPRRDWLLPGNGFLASSRARDKVRAWFHRLDRERNLADGRELLEKEIKRLALQHADLGAVLPRFRLGSVEELYVAVALGDIGPSQVARALHEAIQPPAPAAAPETAVNRPAKPAENFTVEGVGNLLTHIARCCQPVAGEAIVGYLSRQRGVSVHRAGCAALARLLARHPERMLPVEWGRQGGASYSVEVRVCGYDRKGLLKDLTTLIAKDGAHVLAVGSRLDSARGLAELRFTLKVRDFEQLGGLLARLSALPGVQRVERIG